MMASKSTSPSTNANLLISPNKQTNKQPTNRTKSDSDISMIMRRKTSATHPPTIQIQIQFPHKGSIKSSDGVLPRNDKITQTHMKMTPPLLFTYACQGGRRGVPFSSFYKDQSYRTTRINTRVNTQSITQTSTKEIKKGTGISVFF